MSDDDVPWCTHSSVSGWSNAGWAWVHPLCGKPTKLAWEGIIGMPDTRVTIALPKRGITTTTARIGPDTYTLYTNFCIDNSDCYAVAYGKSEESVRDQLRGHVCPAPLRREMHPAGMTAVQKLWHELDDVIDSIKEASKYLDDESDHTEECSIMQEKAYASAVAFSLAVLLAGWYRSREDVLREANRRWKMRCGEMSHESTPGYNYYPAMPLAYAKADDDRPKPVARKTASKPTAPKVATPTVREFSVDERTMILSMASNGTSVADLAKLYNVTPERIETMIPKEGDNTLIGFMFS